MSACLEWVWALSKRQLKTYLVENPLQHLTRDEFEALVMRAVAKVCRESGANVLRANFENIRRHLKLLKE